MKKNGVLNAPLSKVIASMGHTDKLVICDCGLPLPKKAEIVDLALTKNLPRFMDTLKIVLEELCVEEAIVADELIKGNEKYFNEIKALMPGVKFTSVPHEKFKEIYRNSPDAAFVRTGETTSYANIILMSGVTF